MRTARMVCISMIALLLVSSAALAADFSWLKELNLQAQADPGGFRAQLASRFKIGAAEVSTVISNVQQPADAYMVMRLGEMSRQPTDRVMTEYRQNKGKGWGALAQSLGIKPGSPEFHALKRGHDLQGSSAGGGKKKDKGKKGRK